MAAQNGLSADYTTMSDEDIVRCVLSLSAMDAMNILYMADELIASGRVSVAMTLVDFAYETLSRSASSAQVTGRAVLTEDYSLELH